MPNFDAIPLISRDCRVLFCIFQRASASLRVALHHSIHLHKHGSLEHRLDLLVTPSIYSDLNLSFFNASIQKYMSFQEARQGSEITDSLVPDLKIDTTTKRVEVVGFNCNRIIIIKLDIIK